MLRVAIGMPVSYTADAYNGEQFSGKVKEVGVSATQSGRYEVLVQIPNSRFRCVAAWVAVPHLYSLATSKVRLFPEKVWWVAC